MNSYIRPNEEHRFNLERLNAVRIFIVLMIAFGYASTMPIGPGHPELLAHLGHDPSWVGIQLLFFFSGYLALRSARRHGSANTYLWSRIIRNIPLLAVFTLIAVIIIYPIVGITEDSPIALTKKLAFYFFETVSCTDPGRTLPGLLDNAKYMCLIQGAIWTFKWGMIAHIATSIGMRLGLLNKNWLILLATAAIMFAHFVAAYILAKQNPDGLGTPALALRLAYPFMIGMCFYAFEDKLPKDSLSRIVLLALLISTALFQYAYMQWTPLIEIQLTLSWAYALFLIATSRTEKLAFLNNWPNLALGLYLANWPVSQMWVLFVPDITSWGLISVALPTTVIIASLGYWLVSRPLNIRFGLVSPREIALKSPRLQPVINRT